MGHVGCGAMLNAEEIDKILRKPTRKCVVLADIVESVRLVQANEEAVIRRWLNVLEFANEKSLTLDDGNIVKSTGDGLLADFGSEKAALSFAMDLQEYVLDGNAKLPKEQHIFLRIGIENADIYRGFGDIFGHGVNVAARLADLAGPGETVVSMSVRTNIDPGIDADIEDLGECFLKNISKPVRAFRMHPVNHAVDLKLPISTTELQPSIAIVIRPDPGNPMSSEILSEELNFVFSRAQQLRVISRLSSKAVLSANLDVVEIADILGAKFVIFGRTLSDGSTVIAPLALHDGKSGKILWEDRFTLSPNQIIDQIQTISGDIVGAVGRTIISHELRKVSSMPLPTVESYGLLLAAIAGMYSLDRREYERSGEILEHLVYRERRHPLPHAWMANHLVLGSSQGWLSDTEGATQKALAASELALSIDPENEIALTFNGLVRGNLLGELDLAEKRYEAAIGANPSASLATLQFGMLHGFRDDGPEAVRLCMRAQGLSPLDPLKFLYDSLSASCLVTDSQFDAAIVMAERSLKANSAHLSALRTLVLAQWQSGNHEKARETVTKLTVVDPKFSVTRWEENFPDKSTDLSKRLGNIFRKAGVPE